MDVFTKFHNLHNNSLVHGLLFLCVKMFDYDSKKWKRKREWILKRDKYKCCECKRYGKNVEATTVHHIKHADEYPELAFVDTNLQSLCAACHNKKHPEKGGYRRRC